jgi:DnaJ family protein C protein 17
MANNDLHKWVTCDVDFYALLGLEHSNFSPSNLRRAYRKTSLKYHPDKLGADFDPEKYELFQAAYGVLESEELKAKYDGHRQAKLQKQRANELFEGKRRAMKEDLEAREKGGLGVKRSREEEEGEMEMRRLAEEGRKRRAERERVMKENAKADDSTASSHIKPEPKAHSPVEPAQPEPEQAEEDEVAILERRIREAEAAKASRKAEKKARKSGVFTPAPDSPATSKVERESTNSSAEHGGNAQDFATPIKRPRPDIFKGLKADENKTAASPRFSFSPSIATPKRKDFTATMERLKAAEKQRLEEEIRRKEAELSG